MPQPKMDGLSDIDGVNGLGEISGEEKGEA